MVVVFEAELWIWDARRVDGWTFLSLPAEASEDIRDMTAGSRRGFGSSRVRVTLGASTWTTSIFPDSVRGTYVLPIKRAIRNAEDLDVGDIATVRVCLKLIYTYPDCPVMLGVCRWSWRSMSSCWRGSLG